MARMDGELEKLYSDTGRPSIAPERLLRVTLLMILYSIDPGLSGLCVDRES